MRTLKERFAKFFEEPTREGLRDLLENNLGENNNLEFKENYPIYSKLSKAILAIANSGGGCIIVGVSESNEGLFLIGIDTIIDKADLEKGLRRFLPSELKYDVHDFYFAESEYASIKGKKFQVFFVDYEPHLIPFVSLSQGEGIRENAIYIRRGTSSQETDYRELQNLLNNRVETQYSSRTEIEIKEHLEQLQVLYSYVRKHHYRYKGGSMLPALGQLGEFAANIFGEREEVLNPHYPEEDFESFIVKMIKEKKRKIRSVLELM